ncbi:HupE/UreJ family protein [Photobacterium makurazakiensis]|uniref:HupE/UreJ family protein n=1 Tax=Photobacterium makurazakiensis TaxID=2910234 RepID=UPI003D0B51EA
MIHFLFRQGTVFKKTLFAFLGLIASSSVYAHPGHSHHSTGMLDSFWAGLVHPITGFDHLIMLLAVGFIAMQYKPQAQQKHFMVMAVICMVAGMGLGAATGFVTGIELLIIASIFIAALAVYQKQVKTAKVSTLISSAAVLLVLFHGWAHGLEASGVSLAVFASGMALAATAIILCGYRLALYISPKWQSALLATSGTVLLLLAS